MNRGEIETTLLISWTAGGIVLEIDTDKENHVYLHSVRPASVNGQSSDWQFRTKRFSALSLSEVRMASESSQFTTSKRQVQGYLGQRLRYVSHAEKQSGIEKILQVKTEDPRTEITVINQFSVFGEMPVLRSTVRVENTSKQSITLQAVPSLVYGGLTLSTANWWESWHVHYAHNNWLREAQWHERSLPDLGVDYLGAKECSKANFVLSNQGSFSTGGHLPMGGLSRVDGKASYLWQIEHNGSWRWELGDYKDGIYLTASGPTDQEHAWSKKLGSGESFNSVPVALAVTAGDFNSAFAPMNSYRRLIRRSHKDLDLMPVIFNDYMNCLMGDPTDAKVEALIAPAAQAGAEVFVIDCGWYSDEPGWWETVGEWLPSHQRFPKGLEKTLKKIHEAGMVPGLWIEPEVMGIRCPIADTELPPEAFFQRDGKRVVEQGRYQLDYRSSAVVARMDRVIDRLVLELGVGYLKFDYNIDVTQGTDIHCTSPGDGLLDHNRAYLRWVNGIFDRHQGLVIENCSSGAQRMDYAMMATHPLQSTSDQEDPVLYAAIAAAVPTAVCPEQSATWSYPQPSWTDELNAFTVVNSLLGRVHLSGDLGKLSKSHYKLVSDGMAVYKTNAKT
jgi:alpha-galactosidase